MRRLVLVSSLLVACGGGSGNNPDGGGNPDATTPPTDGSTPSDGASNDGNDGGPNIGDSVITRSNHNTRDNVFIQSTFTTAGIATMKLDTTFDGTISGDVYGDVLFFNDGPSGQPVVIVGTQNNQMTALNADTGAVVWQKTFGTPAGQSGAGCGNIGPIGITSTPAIDPVSRTIFFNATQGNANTITDHQIHAISMDDGSERPNFPVNASTATSQNTTLNPVLENQRSALLYLNGVVYVAYGGHAGDCGAYHGWVVGVPYPAGAPVAAYAASTAANTRAAGIWGVSGPASDGTDVYVTTGNSFGATTWVGQEAVLRLTPGPAFSNQTADYWAPHDYLTLDNGDTDIGGTGALLVDVPGATPSSLVVALGKSGVAYLVDRGNLGGVGTSTATDGVSNMQVAGGEIINAPGTITTPNGTYVVFHGYNGAAGQSCKTGSGDLVALQISATSPPKISVPWCAASNTAGSPMITSIDGTNNALVWTVGTHLDAWDLASGKQVYTGTDTLANVRKFTSPIAAHGRIYIGADNKVYSFKP